MPVITGATILSALPRPPPAAVAAARSPPRIHPISTLAPLRPRPHGRTVEDMDLNSLLTVVIALVAIVWFGIRQTTWAPMSRSRAWRSSLLLIGIGVVMMVSARQAEELLTGRNLGALLVELVVGAAVGAAIGMIAHLRPITQASLDAYSARRRRRDEQPTFEARNGVWGLVLWLAMIAARVGLGFFFASIGATGLSTPAAILLFLGVNRLVRSAVILARAGALRSATATDAVPHA